MALVYSSDYDRLPVEPVKRWLALRDLAERRLSESTDPREGVSDDDLSEYCTVLLSAAEELDLAKFDTFPAASVRQHYPNIRAEITALATKLNVRASNANAALSVAVSRSSRHKIFAQVERLRVLITNSDLQENQKKKLISKLDELYVIVNAPRADFAKIMAAVGLIAAGVVGQTTSFLADAPQAIATLVAIVGEEKEAEEEDQRLLQADRAPLQLEDLRSDLDENGEIPF